jgi:signal transduction histidine kinase
MSRGRSPAWPLAYAFLAGATIALSVLGVQARKPFDTSLTAAAAVTVAWLFVGAGAVGLARSQWRRTPLLLIATGLALLVRMLRYSSSAPLFAVGFALGELNLALMLHAVLSYRREGVRDRPERTVVVVAYLLAICLPIASLLVFAPLVSCFLCMTRAAPQSLLLVHASNRAWVDLGNATAIGKGVFGATLVLLLARRLLADTNRGRGARAPLVVAGIALGSRGIAEAAVALPHLTAATVDRLYWWEVGAEAAIPVALMLGLLRARFAQAALAELFPALAGATPHEVRDVLARALDDPSLELVLASPGAGAPRADATRGVACVEGTDGMLAWIVHDASLRQETELVAAATAAAQLALENARLADELRAQIAALAASRARVVAAADAERRRIERNIHDGTQQRLLGVALELRSAERRGDPAALRTAAGAAVGELQRAVNELRDLAQGVHPSILSEEGLVAALQSAAQRSPIPVELTARVDGRLPPEVESTTYFLVSETLANVAKHANATAANVRVTHEDGRVLVEVTDDGVGGADPRGSGLTGLVERVEAHGGRLHVISPPGGGTHVVSEIPCAS